MPKMISPLEMSEIVTGLLVKPELFNELTDADTWERFFTEISETVTRYCGGEVVGLADAKTTNASNREASVAAAILPTNELRSGTDCVWGPYDCAWTQDELNAAWIEPGEPLAEKSSQEKRQAVHALLSPSTQIIMEDWDTSLSDPSRYKVCITVGEGMEIDFTPAGAEVEPTFSVMLEVSKGVPALHLYHGDESPALHVHAAPQGIVLTPDCDDVKFIPCEPCLHSYDQNGSLLIQVENRE